MTLSSNEEAEIVRLYYAEKWKINSIAVHLSRHYSSIKRVIHDHELNPIKQANKRRGSILDEYDDFIKETLQKYPRIAGTRIFHMLKERGYCGKHPNLVLYKVAQCRPKKKPEAFLRLRTLPGEEGQVDWAHFGKVKVGKAERNLSAFVLTLSHSRMIYLRFFYSQGIREFLQGFVEAFEFFEGVPRKILLDNLKAGVTDRVGSFINYNEQFLSLSKHYCFEPVAVGVRKGNEKGRVERSIQYVRSNFFSGREFENIEKLNLESMHWCQFISADRGSHTDPAKKVIDIFMEEKSKLLPLPKTPFLPYDRKIVSIGKTPYARYDLNDYSVPPKYVLQNLDLRSTETMIEIYSGIEKVAEHKRSYDKKEIIENNEHVDEILKTKKRAIQGSALHKILILVPEAECFLDIITKRGESISGATNSLKKMLDLYGKELLAEAIQEVVVLESPKLKSLHFSLKRLFLDKKDDFKNKSKIEIKSEKFANAFVQHHDTSHYDNITGIKK